MSMFWQRVQDFPPHGQRSWPSAYPSDREASAEAWIGLS